MKYETITILGGLVALLARLIFERFRLKKALAVVPLRIAVTGTRGKSSVVRLVAAMLRESGTPTLAKTTGSMPMWIYPDGSEHQIRRRGIVTILEQTQLLQLARKLRVQAMVSEVMSITPENQYAESAQILHPTLAVVTNVRSDHRAQMGPDLEHVARALALSVPVGGTVVKLPDAFSPLFFQRATAQGSKAIEVDVAAQMANLERLPLPYVELPENLALALAVGQHLGISRNTCLRGIQGVTPDVGSLKVWSLNLGTRAPWYAVNAFAANEPQSTSRVLEEATRLVADSMPWIGLLNLRADRGDRTLQWAKALEAGFAQHFDHLALVGLHAGLLRRRLKRVHPRVTVLKGSNPNILMEQLRALEPDGAVVFGFGNIGGPGRRLVEQWEQRGTTHHG